MSPRVYFFIVDSYPCYCVRKIPSESHRWFTFLSLIAYLCLLDAIPHIPCY
ncbi:hypothetical protein Syun_004937 [Stephania yunnanensis]|uniref:Uncharacterized protein n=1 Tax=Stephania yunnanensis TaxID=152371 RepID=A0AAP0Q1V9_9MAGN